MSSLKDYVLEVSLSSGQDNLVKFTVKHKTSIFYKYLQTPILLFLGGILLSYCVGIYNYIKDGAWKVEGNSWPIIENNQTISPIITKYFQDMFDSDESRTNELIFGGAVLALLLVAIAAVFCKQEKEDSILIVNDIGVQLTSKSGWKSPRSSRSHFIPIDNIIDLVIHEGFHGYGQVIFYMCVLTKTKRADADKIMNSIGMNTGNRIEVVFPEFLPRKDILMTVWKQGRNVLFGDKKRYWRRVPGQGLKECY